MFALCAMAVALGLLVLLIHLKVRLGRAIVASAVVLGILLRITPHTFWQTLVKEWQVKPLTQTTGHLSDHLLNFGQALWPIALF